MQTAEARRPPEVVWRANPGPQTTFLASRANEALYGGAAGGGKLLYTGEMIPTPRGFVRLRDLVPGDDVFGRDGRPTRVLAESPLVVAPAYRLAFDDGSTVVAHDEHLWLTFDADELAQLTRRDPAWKARRRAARPSRAGKNKSKAFRAAIAARNAQRAQATTQAALPGGTVRTTAAIVATLRTARGRANHAMPVCEPLDLPPVALPLDPYVLGAWLGDGSTQAPNITSMDAELIDAVVAAGFAVMTRTTKPQNRASTYSFRGLRAALKTVGVFGNKHVPDAYLWASEPQRLALLQGLMDTDGGVESGSASFTSTKLALAEAVAFLARSLGHKATIREGTARLHGRAIGPKWTVKFRPRCQVFRLARKAARLEISTRRTTRFRYVVAAERVAPCELKCIKVAGEDGLFLATDHLLVTHNSAALLAMPLRWIDNPGFRGLYLRRESAYLGDAIDKSTRIYPAFGARLRQSPRTEWTFPSGATIWFSHSAHENDVRNFDSFELSLVLFDELTHFTEKQYTGIRARLRGTDPTLPYASRAATNPGGEGHEWVFARWAAWLDPRHPRPAAPGERRWFRGEDEVPANTLRALSRTFIPAKLADNPHVDPAYASVLMQLDPVRRAQLEDGNWLVKPAAGAYFKRGWIKEWPDLAPARTTRRIRYWDLAAGGDYAVGTRYSRAAPLWCVEDVVRLRGTPGQVRAAVFATMKQDGHGVETWIEQDPGQAGKDQVHSYTTAPEAQGFVLRFRPKRVDKVTSYGPFSAQAQAGNVAVVRGAWNDAWLAEQEAFPDGAHDDQCDSVSGAHAVLTDRGAELMQAAMKNVFKTGR